MSGRCEITRKSAEERYRPTAGRRLAAVATACLGAGCAATALNAGSTAAAAGAVALGWAALVAYLMFLRPLLMVRDDHLLLRNALSDTEVPWHLIDDVSVRQHVTKVSVGTAAHYGAGAGTGRSKPSWWRRWRRLDQSARTAGLPAGRGRGGRAADAVELRLLALARERQAMSRSGREQVVRHRAVSLLVALALPVVAFVVLVALS